MTIVRNPACLIGGLGLLLTSALVPFISREGQLLGLGQAELRQTALVLSHRYSGFWLLIALGLLWVVLGLARQHHPERGALWGGARWASPSSFSTIR